MFPDQGPESAPPRLSDEDVAAVAVGEAAQAEERRDAREKQGQAGRVRKLERS